MEKHMKTRCDGNHDTLLEKAGDLCLYVCAPTLLASGAAFHVKVEFADGRASAHYPRGTAGEAAKWNVGDDR